MMKIITWVDLDGRYRVTSPAYNDAMRPAGETEDEAIIRVWARIKAHYGLPDNHAFHLVEDADQRIRVKECAETSFRYGISDTSAQAGAWEMDTDGRPKVNMPKARVIKTDQIRPERNDRLAVLDTDYIRADEAGNTVEKNKIVTLKQKLRDLPTTIQSDLDDIDQPETLKVYEPSWPEKE